jgi:peptidoglycan hydrolase CwlO-like protein
MKSKNVVAVVALSLFLFSGYAFSQQASPYAVDPKSDQGKDLKIAQLETQNAAYQFQQAQQNYQSKLSALQNKAKEISDDMVKQHKWPETVEYNMNTGNFEDHPKAKEEKK